MNYERTKPILPGTAPTDYERYLRTDELLSLQKTPEEVVHRDEHLFQTVHQGSELWLKLACLELEQATTLLAGDGVAAAVRLLRRANRLHGPGDVAAPHARSPLPRRLHGRPDGARARRGVRLPGFKPRPSQFAAARARRSTRCSRAAVVTLLDVYDRGYELEDLYQLAEQMITWDERVILWRFHHLKVVERIIGGSVIGTQGTPVEVLGSASTCGSSRSCGPSATRLRGVHRSEPTVTVISRRQVFGDADDRTRSSASISTMAGLEQHRDG